MQPSLLPREYVGIEKLSAIRKAGQRFLSLTTALTSTNPSSSFEVKMAFKFDPLPETKTAMFKIKID